MGSIKATYHNDKNLTTIQANGRLSASYFNYWLEKYYAGKYTLLILWDLRNADLSGIRTDQFRFIQDKNAVLAEARAGGKTALVFGDDYSFGLGRMFESLAEINEMPFKIKSFLDMEEAKKWLGV